MPYFECPEKHGLFAKVEKVKLLSKGSSPEQQTKGSSAQHNKGASDTSSADHNTAQHTTEGAEARELQLQLQKASDKHAAEMQGLREQHEREVGALKQQLEQQGKDHETALQAARAQARHELQQQPSHTQARENEELHAKLEAAEAEHSKLLQTAQGNRLPKCSCQRRYPC